MNASEKQIIILNRDCTALLVPSGARIMLHEGTEVTVTQSLGSSYTVSVYGNLARIDGKDADAFRKHRQTRCQNYLTMRRLKKKFGTN